MQISEVLNITLKGGGRQQNLLEKAYFIAKMSGPAMVRPASSDFWKASQASSWWEKCLRKF